MLQFANKPDIAYEMCSTIAPNCDGIGDAQLISENYETERQPSYKPENRLGHTAIQFQREKNPESNQYATERGYNPLDNRRGYSNYATEQPISEPIDNMPDYTDSSEYENENEPNQPDDTVINNFATQAPFETTPANAFTLDSDGTRQYGHYGRNRTRYRPDLYAAASREFATERPSFSAVNQISFAGSSDEGIFLLLGFNKLTIFL